MAGFRYHISRLYSRPLAPEKKPKEWELIQTITKKNNFSQKLPQKLNRQIQQKIDPNQTEKKKKIVDYIYSPQPNNKKNH